VTKRGKKAPEPIKESPKPEAPKEMAVSQPALITETIKDRDRLLKLQDEKRLVNYDPSTGEATYRRA